MLLLLNCSSKVDRIEYRDSKNKPDKIIFTNDDFSIYLTYLWQDIDSLIYGDTDENKKYALIQLDFFGDIKIKGFLITDLLIEIKDLNDQTINFKKITLLYSGGYEKNDIEEEFNSVEALINRKIDFIYCNCDNYLGNILINYNKNDIPEKIKLTYRIKFIYDNTEHVIEETVELQKKIIEEEVSLLR